MDTRKLREALQDLKSQRDILTTAITSIENALSMLGEQGGQGPVNAGSPKVSGDDESSFRTYVDDAVTVLERHGHPLSIKVLCEKIGTLRGGEPVKRALVESGLSRHVSKTKEPRVVRAGRAMYGLAEWQKQPQLVSLAG